VPGPGGDLAREDDPVVDPDEEDIGGEGGMFDGRNRQA
jgi:hypothetical protein